MTEAFAQSVVATGTEALKDMGGAQGAAPPAQEALPVGLYGIDTEGVALKIIVPSPQSTVWVAVVACVT